MSCWWIQSLHVIRRLFLSGGDRKQQQTSWGFVLFSEVFCQASTCTNDVFIVCFCGLKVDFDLQLLPERFLLRQHAKCCWTLLWGQSSWTAAASMPQRPVTQQLQEQPTFPGTRCPPNMNWFRTVCGLDLKELSEFHRLLRDRFLLQQNTSKHRMKAEKANIVSSQAQTCSDLHRWTILSFFLKG